MKMTINNSKTIMRCRNRSVNVYLMIRCGMC
jgi:hypothetical protein